MDAKFIVTIFTNGITITAGWFDDAKFARNFADDCIKRSGKDAAITLYDTETTNRVYHAEYGTVIVDNVFRYV